MRGGERSEALAVVRGLRVGHSAMALSTIAPPTAVSMTRSSSAPTSETTLN